MLSEHLLSPGRESANADTVRNMLGPFCKLLIILRRDRCTKITHVLKYYRWCPDVRDSMRDLRRGLLYWGTGEK